MIHIAFHARAMEMYTNAHQQLLNIDVAHDLEVILRRIQMNIIHLLFRRNFVRLHHFIVFKRLNEVQVKQR